MDYEHELTKLKNIIENKLYEKSFYVFLEKEDLEFDYAEHEIYEIWDKFMSEAKQWIKENHPNQFVLFYDWCVHLLTIDYVKEKYPELLVYAIT